MKRYPAQALAAPAGIVVMAHRGNRGHVPENTILALQQAVELGADALEIDIHATADQVLVVSHDATVDRTTDGTGPIRQFAFAALNQLDAGYRWTADGGHVFPFRGCGLTIPSLAEVFATFPDIWINIDIKQSEPSIVLALAHLIRAHEMSQKVLVGSFDALTIRSFRRACPRVATAASVPEVRRMVLLSQLRLGCIYAGRAQAFQVPEYNDNGRIRIVTPRFIRSAHRRGIAVHVWTVNEVADMVRLIEWGADGLITDYPERLLRLLGRL